MAPNPNIPYNPADHGAPTTLLPEEVFGHVDVATLADIHRYLRESEAQDDIELATWIQENYLYDVKKDQSTATIRTAQGFAQLDRAYRRVRSLTNKAQDKWPFFDRNFKQMSTATVRNNARGEAAPGVMYPVDSAHKSQGTAGQPQIPSVSNGSDIPNASPTPQLQVPFGSTKPSRYQPYKQEYPRPAQQTPVPLPTNLPTTTNAQQAARFNSTRSASPAPGFSKSKGFMESDGRAMSEPGQPQPAASPTVASQVENGVMQNASEHSAPEPMDTNLGPEFDFHSNGFKAEPIRDAGGGKVRGPNGRYLPKDDVSASPKKVKKLKIKARKPGSKAIEQKEPPTPEASSEKTEDFPAEQENEFVEVQTPSTPPPDQEVGDNNSNNSAAMLAVSDPSPSLATGSEAEQPANASTGPTPAYLLAAEADAVPSNLDRLPPNSRRAMKRKSEPVVQEGERKRGKYGGIVGRPRKSERENRNPIKDQDTEPGNMESAPELPPQMVTRRSARRSAAANLETSAPAEPTMDSEMKDSSSPKKQAVSDDTSANHDNPAANDTPMKDVEEDRIVDHENTPAPIRKGRKSGARAAGVSTNNTPLKKASVKEISEKSTAKIKSATSRAKSGSYKSTHQTLSPSPTDMAQKGTSHDHVKGSTSQGTPDVTAGTTGEAERPHPLGHVELFARVTTGNGVMEIPIPADQINSDEAKMIKKYAEWNAQPDAKPVPYDQFRQIFSFAKKD